MSEKEYPDWLIEARNRFWEIGVWLDMHIAGLSDGQRALAEAEYAALVAAQSVIFQRIKYYCGDEAVFDFIENGQSSEGEQ